MKTIQVLLLVLGLTLVAALVVLVLSGGGTFHEDVASFRGKPGPYVTAGLAPACRVNTHVSRFGAMLVWGGARSRSPYDLVLEHTDGAGTLERLEVDSVVVTYADGSVETAGVAALGLPLRFNFREVETVNSTRTGIVRGRVSVLHGVLPAVVTKDQDFELWLEGRFVDRSGAVTPFRLVEPFEFRRDTGSRPMVEVWQEI